MNFEKATIGTRLQLGEEGGGPADAACLFLKVNMCKSMWQQHQRRRRRRRHTAAAAAAADRRRQPGHDEEKRRETIAWMAENTPFWCIPTDTALPFACYAADTEPKGVQNERKRGLFSRVSSTHLSLRPLNSQSVSRPNRHTVAIFYQLVCCEATPAPRPHPSLAPRPGGTHVGQSMMSSKQLPRRLLQ